MGEGLFPVQTSGLVPPQQSALESPHSGAWGSPVSYIPRPTSGRSQRSTQQRQRRQQQAQPTYTPLVHSPVRPRKEQRQRQRAKKPGRRKQKTNVWRQAPIPLGSPKEFEARAAAPGMGAQRSPKRPARRGGGGGGAQSVSAAAAGSYAAAHSSRRASATAALSPVSFRSGTSGGSSVAGSGIHAIRAARQRGRYGAEEF